jgi:ADP-ribose pyrophosphatase
MTMDIREKFISKDKIYKGKFIEVEKRKYELCDGKEAIRDIVVSPDACAVVAVDENNDLYLVEQYRAAFDKILLEIPAGKIDPGETPEKCVKRELEEETGLCAKNFIRLASIAVSPGFCTEIIHIYLAKDLKIGNMNPDEDEHLLVSKMNIHEARNKVFDGTFSDAKTISGILLACEYLKI